ncbi:MAG TPA: hypothetical protein VFD01_16500 [Candidatus Dormibacteraeota bacterium]|nr:hypothetical protein [Candidatus Dormibacteraeota bacterium]
MSLCFRPPRLRDLEAELRRREPCWLLIGGVEEVVVERLLGRLMVAHAGVRVAMLGEGSDRQRCERWLRWGCDAYRSAAAPAERVLGLLRAATDCRVLLVDAVARRDVPSGSDTTSNPARHLHCRSCHVAAAWHNETMWMLSPVPTEILAIGCSPSVPPCHRDRDRGLRPQST